MRTQRRIRLVFLILLAVLVLPVIIPLPPVGVDAAALADPGGTFMTVSGLSTYVLAAGPADGVPVLLLHGWGASTFTWRENQSALAEAGYRAIAFDRPPYGLSAKTGDNIPYSPGALADFTAQVMDALHIDSAILIGQSQGGGVIGHFAVKYPARVRALVFVSAALRPTDDPSPPNDGGRAGGALGIPPVVTSLLNFPPFARWAQIGIRAFVTPDFAARILRGAYYDPAFMTPEAAEGYSRQLRVVGWDEALLHQLRGGVFQTEPISAAQIAAIDAPTMIVWGEADTWVPITVGERLRELLPEAVYVTYENAGHLPHEEAAAAFNRDLLDFLAENTLSST